MQRRSILVRIIAVISFIVVVVLFGALIFDSFLKIERTA